MENRVRRILDTWWEEQRGDLLTRIVNSLSEDAPEEDPASIHAFEMLAHPFMETVSIHRSSDNISNLLQFTLNNIMSMFPEVPVLPNPNSETDIHEVMRDHSRRANFFSSFSIPESLNWAIVTNGTLPLERTDNPDQECSICLDNIRKDTQVFSLVCGHKFHCHCLCRVLCEPTSPKCPLCRCDINFTD